jgi:hydroxymethylpyrimidine/phosphomethylpyrimidine kinase
MEDTVPLAVKTGMLANGRIVEAVTEALKDSDIALVTDPVIRSTSGAILLDKEGCEKAMETLFSRAILITPNIPEAEYLSGITIEDHEDMIHAADRISNMLSEEGNGPAVLIKGGHLQGGAPMDILYIQGKTFRFPHPKIEKGEVHGTGCLLSAAITALLARGSTLYSAVESAISFTTKAIEHAFPAGKGAMPANSVWPQVIKEDL